MTDDGPGVLDLVARQGVVPVLTVRDGDDVGATVAALADGGLGVVEITLRTPDALDAIRVATDTVPAATVGAGTVCTAADARAAFDAGARFCVSPGLDDGVVAVAQERGAPVLPGVATPTEVMRARSLGIEVVKVFPAEPLGGVAAVAALAAVWPSMRFVPTGGIDATRAVGYLDLPAVLAVGGSWMVDRAAVAEHRWDDVRAAARAAAALVGARRDGEGTR